MFNKDGNLKNNGAYGEFVKNTGPGEAELAAQRSAGFLRMPFIGVIVFATGASKEKIAATVESVRAQSYENYELTVAADESKHTYLDKRFGISSAYLTLSEAAVGSAGNYLTFINAGDIFMPNALYEFAAAVNKRGNCEFIFADEDEIVSGVRKAPFFKPVPSMETLMSYNSVGMPLMASRGLFTKTGGLKDLSGASLYEFSLKCMRSCAAEGGAAHIPKVLLSREKPDYSVSSRDGRRILNELIKDSGGHANSGLFPNSFWTRPALKKRHSIDIIIPVRDELDELRECLESVEETSLFDRYEFIISDMGSVNPKLIRYYDLLEKNGAARVIRTDKPIFEAKALNTASSAGNGDTVLFMSPYCRMLNPDALEVMLEYAQLDDIGFVAPKLVDGVGRIFSVGTVVGIGGWTDSPYRGEADGIYEDLTKNRFINAIRNVTAADSNCMMLSADVFSRMGGFDESFERIGYTTELSIRLVRAGCRNVYMPHAKFECRKPYTDYKRASDSDKNRLYDVIRPILTEGDPMYSPNYDFSVGVPIPAEKVKPPIFLNEKYKAFTDNFQY